MNYHGIEVTPEEALFMLKLKIEIAKLHKEDVLPQVRKWMKLKVTKRELELIQAIVANEKSEFSSLIKTIIVLD